MICSRGIAHREDVIHTDFDPDHALVLPLDVRTDIILCSNETLTMNASMRAEILRRISLTSATSACDSRTRRTVPRSCFASMQAVSRKNDLHQSVNCRARSCLYVTYSAMLLRRCIRFGSRWLRLLRASVTAPRCASLLPSCWY